MMLYNINDVTDTKFLSSNEQKNKDSVSLRIIDFQI